MIVAALMLQAAAAPPHDWSALPVFPLPRAGQVSDGVPFVRAEIAAGRCKTAEGAENGLTAPVAILVGDGGRVMRIVPRAIDCPTVEQFTVGLLLALTRGGPGSATPPAPGWYRLSVSYAW